MAMSLMRMVFRMHGRSSQRHPRAVGHELKLVEAKMKTAAATHVKRELNHLQATLSQAGTHDAKADHGLARPPCRGGATENLPTAHERAGSGKLVRMTRDEDANTRAWFHPVQRAPVSSQTRTVKLVT